MTEELPYPRAPSRRVVAADVRMDGWMCIFVIAKEEDLIFVDDSLTPSVC